MSKQRATAKVIRDYYFVFCEHGDLVSLNCCDRQLALSKIARLGGRLIATSMRNPRHLCDRVMP